MPRTLSRTLLAAAIVATAILCITASASSSGSSRPERRDHVLQVHRTWAMTSSSTPTTRRRPRTRPGLRRRPGRSETPRLRAGTSRSPEAPVRTAAPTGSEVRRKARRRRRNVPLHHALTAELAAPRPAPAAVAPAAQIRSAVSHSDLSGGVATPRKALPALCAWRAGVGPAPARHPLATTTSALREALDRRALGPWIKQRQPPAPPRMIVVSVRLPSARSCAIAVTGALAT